MPNAYQRIPTKGPEYTEHDSLSNRKRVATFVDGTTVSYEDTAFASGDDNSVLDIYTDLDREGHEGYFVNDGPGTIQVEFSADGTTYGGIHTVEDGEVLNFSNLKIRKIRLGYIDDSSYRVMVA